MKMITVATMAILATGIAIGDSTPPLPIAPTAAPTEQQQKRRRRKHITPEMQMQKFGGFVTAPYDGRHCYVMNAQKRVQATVLEWFVQQVSQVLSLPVHVEPFDADGKDTFAPIKTAWSSCKKTGAVLSVVDSPGWTTVLVAPEDGWAQVNIAALAKDGPSAEVLEGRVKKELWRAFVQMFGGGNSYLAGDLMRPINSLKDLDAFPNLVPGPEPFNAVLDGARARGISVVRRTTYKAACEEGWAAAPTNQHQKAIWDKVHEMPTEPIKIKPETKKVTE